MSSCRERSPRAALGVLACLTVLAAGSALAQPQTTAYPGIGRAATPREVAAWDIDVRPDFKGLPAGTGSVAQGQLVWEAQCASCHGMFGESNEVFSPLVGGTSAADGASGRVARLDDGSFPGRTTMMKLSTLSTLWDYIRRAMPWNAPKTLATDEVYAVTAYLLHLGGVLPDDFVLSNANIASVQQRLPNRHGLTTRHALWPGEGLGPAAGPDVQGSACMKDCGPAPRVASFLPEHARNSHGNLAQQQRLVGPLRGADTGPATRVAMARPEPAALALAQTHGCSVCHGADAKMVGPAWREIAARYAGRDDAAAHLARQIKAGGQGVWGAVTMPPQTLPDDAAQAIAAWLATGAPR